MQNSDEIWPLVEKRREAYRVLADRVFDTPEVCYTETKSAAAHIEQMEAEGFRIRRDLAGIPTAMVGEAGSGGPVIAFLGEYDALPGLGQEPGAPSPRPWGESTNGHGCGHNLLGSAALMAASALKDWLAETGTPGRVRYYGCPAEEGGAAKTFMVRAGEFDDVDAAITWHPADYNAVYAAYSLANARINFTFTGRAAHAASQPELGRSGLDAVELMNVGINYMREHMPDSARVHYSYLDAGGKAANVVQAQATVQQLIRATSLSDLFSLIDRVRKIAQGAALMTETEVSEQMVSAVSNLLGNDVLDRTLQANLERTGPMEIDAGDTAFARAIRATLTTDHLNDLAQKLGRPALKTQELCDFVLPLGEFPLSGLASTDVGDVSWAVPTVQAYIATCAIGTPFHSWQLTAQGKSPFAIKGMELAAKVMAGTGRDLIADPALLAAARAEHHARIADTPYVCPMPTSVNPPIPHAA